MRRPAALALALALAACGGSRASGPAWPKSAGTVENTDPAADGGESLEPRSTEHPAAAIEISEEPTVAAVVPEAPAAAATPTPTPTVTPTPPAPTGETMEIQVEEITITPGDIQVDP